MAPALIETFHRSLCYDSGNPLAAAQRCAVPIAAQRKGSI